MCSAKICFCFPYRFHRTQRRTLQRRVNGLHVKAHGKRIADTPGGFPHIDGEGGEERRAGGVEQGSLVPKLLQSFSGLHCHPETPLTPPVSPLSSPSLPSSTALKLLPFLCVSSSPPPPTSTKRSHLLAFNTSSRPLCVVLSSSPNPSPSSSLPLASPPSDSFCRNTSENQNNRPYVFIWATVCAWGGSLPYISGFYCTQ